MANLYDQFTESDNVYDRFLPTPSALPSPEGHPDTGTFMGGVVQAAKEAIPTSVGGAARMVGESLSPVIPAIENIIDEPKKLYQVSQALHEGKPLRESLEDVFGKQKTYDQFTKEDWGKLAGQIGLQAAMALPLVGGALALPKLKPRQVAVEPPATMPGETGFTLAPSQPPQPLPEVPVPPSFQPVGAGQPIPYGPEAQPYQQPPQPAGGIAPTDMWPLSGQPIPAEDVPYAGQQPAAPQAAPQVEPPPPVQPPPPVPAPQPKQAPLLPGVKAPRKFSLRPAFDTFGTEVTPVSQYLMDSVGGVKSKSAAKAQGKFEGNNALWDGAPALSHPTHNKIYKAGGEMPDNAAQALFDAGLIEDPYVDTMWQHIEAESRAARQIAKQTQRESATVKAVTKQDKSFQRVQQDSAKSGKPEIAGRDLQVGDTVDVAGEKFKVTEIDPDTFDVTLEDGTRFGIQHVADNEVIYGEHERPAPLKLAEPESDAEMLAREKAEAEANAALALEAAKKDRVKHGWKQKLAGDEGDVGQQELGGPLGESESLFGRGGIERSGESGGVPLPFKGRVMAPGAVRGSGRYKGVYQVNKEAGDLTNALAASRESAALKAEYKWRQVVGDLSPVEQDALGRYLVSERLKTVNPDHPQILPRLETALIERNPRIARALNRYKREVKPDIEVLRKKAGLTATAAEGKGREFISLVASNDEPLPQAQTPVGGVPLKFRSKTTTFAQKARGLAAKYDTDLRTILSESYGEVTEKARFRELYDSLVKNGLTSVEPVDEIKGQPAQATIIGRAAKGENSAALPEVAYMPEQISSAIRDIMETPPKIESAGWKAVAAAQRGVTGAALTANPGELVNHMRRQLDVVSAIPAAHAPLPIRAAEGMLPFFGPRLGTAVRVLTTDMSLPENQSILQDIFDAGGGSTRAFREYQAKGWLARTTRLDKVQHFTQKLLFGVPKGRGVGGWDLRMRVQLEKIRREIEGNTDPQRIREFSNQLGQYTSKPNKFIEIWRKFQPYAATTGPMRVTEFRQLVGGSGLKAKTTAGALGLRAETLLRGAGGTAIALITANKLLSGNWPWENDKGHEFDLKTGMRDNNGKNIYVNVSKFAPTLGRPIKSLSLPEILRERGATEGKSYGSAAMVGPTNTLLSGISGPLSNAAFTLGTGYAPYFVKEPGHAPNLLDLASTHGQPQEGLMGDRFMRQTVAALTGINPVGRSFGETNLPTPLNYVQRPIPGIEPFGPLFTTSYEKRAKRMNTLLDKINRDKQRQRRLGR